ncbi:MAG: SHOCT domain-containing protein [Chloroflexota bacterium]
MGALFEYGAILAAGVALVLALFVAVRLLARGLFGRDRRLERAVGLEVLDARLARGEITREEYEQGKRALGA